MTHDDWISEADFISRTFEMNKGRTPEFNFNPERFLCYCEEREHLARKEGFPLIVKRIRAVADDLLLHILGG